jgi:hypothetical protein
MADGDLSVLGQATKLYVSADMDHIMSFQYECQRLIFSNALIKVQ